MQTGTVKFFNASKGYGFITEDDTNTEHFVHISGLIDEDIVKMTKLNLN